MAECTSGKDLTVLVLDASEALSLEQFFLDHLDEVHNDPNLEATALALGAL